MKRNFTRRRRLIGASAASAGTIAIAATAAFGHIPGVGNGLAPTTNGPDLRSVTVLTNDLNDGIAEQARFCFDGALERLSAAPAANFAIQTYDARRAMNPSTLSKATDDPKCLIASFPSGVDIAQGNVGQVTPGAVSDVSNRANDYASEPVSGGASSARAGATTGPDLISVTVDSTNAANKLIVYTFDENINPAPSVAYSAANFGYYNGEGNAVAGTGSVNLSGAKAIVGFGAASGPEAASRFFVNAGAVQDRPQTAVIAPATTLTTPSSPGYLATAVSPRPTIAGVAAIGPQSFKVTFTQAVSFVPGDAAGFIAVSDDGTAPAAASSLGTGGDPTSIVATFPAAVSADPASIVHVLVNPGTVTAGDGITTNPADQASTSTPHDVPGFTNGPDLLAIGVDATLNRVVYKYDENVNRDVPPDPGDARDRCRRLGHLLDRRSCRCRQLHRRQLSRRRSRRRSRSPTRSTGSPIAPGGTTRARVSDAIKPGAPAPVVPPPVVAPPPPVAAPVAKFKTFVTIKRRGKRYWGKVRSTRTQVPGERGAWS